MKIGIIGNYGHNNNGDEAILTGILKQLIEELSIPNEDIVVFSNNPKDTEQRYGVKAVPIFHRKGPLLFSIMKTLKENYFIMRKLDAIIVGGGGILMDLYKWDGPLYATLGLLGHYAGCKVIVYGVGVGPIETKLGALFIKQLSQKAFCISVRDEQSKRLLQALGVKRDIHVIGDPALYLAAPNEKKESRFVQKVAVTAVPYYNGRYWPTSNEQKYSNYVTGMAKNLDQLIEKKNVTVTFFSTKYPQDVQVTKDIASRMKHSDRVTIIDENLHPNDIVSLCASHDLVIGTRLHSLILAVVAKTPIIGVGYHPKVHHFLTFIRQADRYVSVEELGMEPTSFVQIVEKMEKNWLDIQQETRQIAEQMREKAGEGIKLLRLMGEKHVR
jgi:polysaccharide pyruvyl transferase CsaB